MPVWSLLVTWSCSLPHSTYIHKPDTKYYLPLVATFKKYLSYTIDKKHRKGFHIILMWFVLLDSGEYVLVEEGSDFPCSCWSVSLNSSVKLPWDTLGIVGNFGQCRPIRYFTRTLLGKGQTISCEIRVVKGCGAATYYFVLIVWQTRNVTIILHLPLDWQLVCIKLKLHSEWLLFSCSTTYQPTLPFSFEYCILLEIEHIFSEII